MPLSNAASRSLTLPRRMVLSRTKNWWEKRSRLSAIDVVIATKFGFGINPDGTRYGLDSRPDHIRQVTDASLTPT